MGEGVLDWGGGVTGREGRDGGMGRGKNGRGQEKELHRGERSSTWESTRSGASWQAETGCFVSKQGAP